MHDVANLRLAHAISASEVYPAAPRLTPHIQRSDGENVGFSEFGPSVSLALYSDVPSTLHHVATVVRESADQEVFGVYTKGSIAAMANDKAVSRTIAVCRFIRHPMGLSPLTIGLHATIPSGKLVAGPKPTLASASKGDLMAVALEKALR
jgi:hypothetical protein